MSSMLAHNGLALITEKLQNQRLEEPPNPQTLGSCGSGGGSKLPQLGYDNTAKTLCQHQANLAVKGKNVWALTVESERPGRQTHEFTAPEVATPRPPTLRPLAEKASSPALLVPSVCCRHKKLRQACHFCDSAPGTPTAPPKKKHCRSLSVPPDSAGGFTTLSASRDASGRLWKPIAVIPLTDTSDGNVSGAFENQRDRLNSPEMVASPVNPGPPNSEDVTGGRWLPRLLSSGLKLVPSASAASSDSGHFTTSDFQTPPGSPVPVAAVTRPASAASDTASSFSSQGSAWLDWSGGGATLSGRAFRGTRALQNRSLSCEDRISGSSFSFFSSPYTSAAAANTTSMPCMHADALGGMDASCCSNTALSARCRSGSHDSSSNEQGLACRGNIPRCHSQPCVLHHRRCGKKRRRNCDRPTLNFNKMTETAYMRGNRRSEPWSTPVFIQQASMPGLYKPLESGIGPSTTNPGGRLSFVLNPIASSPLDSDLPAEAVSLASRDLDLRHAASVALPLTPPDQASPTFPGRPKGEHKVREDKEEEEEEEETDHTNCPCHDSRAEDGVGLVFPMTDLDLEQIENH